MRAAVGSSLPGREPRTPGRPCSVGADPAPEPAGRSTRHTPYRRHQLVLGADLYPTAMSQDIWTGRVALMKQVSRAN